MRLGVIETLLTSLLLYRNNKMYLAIMYPGKATGLLMQQVNLFKIDPLDATKCSTIMLCNLSKYALVIEIDML